MANFLEQPPMRSLLCSASPAWRSRQLVITPEQLGLRSVGECQQRVERLGLTPLPMLPYRQEYWRLDALLAWSRGNGFDRLPMLGSGSPRAESRGSHGAS